MKSIILGLALATVSITACNNNDHNDGDGNDHMNTDKSAVEQSTETPKAEVSTKEIITGYLQIKNALTADNSKDAAASATALETTFKNFDKTALTAEQKKVFEDIEGDAMEHAEHIGTNSGNLAHQREHFDILSKDMIDLLKTFGSGGKTLYKDFCPMYNENKGAFWISETKDIKNPYYGKAMLTCGTMNEEIK